MAALTCTCGRPVEPMQRFCFDCGLSTADLQRLRRADGTLPKSRRDLYIGLGAGLFFICAFVFSALVMGQEKAREAREAFEAKNRAAETQLREEAKAEAAAKAPAAPTKTALCSFGSSVGLPIKASGTSAGKRWSCDFERLWGPEDDPVQTQVTYFVQNDRDSDDAPPPDPKVIEFGLLIYSGSGDDEARATFVGAVQRWFLMFDPDDKSAVDGLLRLQLMGHKDDPEVELHKTIQLKIGELHYTRSRRLLPANHTSSVVAVNMVLPPGLHVSPEGHLEK